jgi:hypothetical protein
VLTDNLKLEDLVLPHGFIVSSTFVLFPSEVLDGFVIKQDISMNTASNLGGVSKFSTGAHSANGVPHHGHSSVSGVVYDIE